ncbi:hypothetical protein [Haloferula sp. BvORR071]|uniref:hypothetical protein n=1 Tax=Haloferula sp. BvORR071 TaxID=1396141 RepID=UPI000553899B|nr:hypothetical protein [Haloferula sp. BvORR071]
MANQKHAPLSALKEAIRGFRVIRFTCDGEKYVVEPSELGRSERGSMQLSGWVREGPHASGLWMDFHYWKIRELEIQDESFSPPPQAAPVPFLVARGR